ncbi:thioredoxin-like protein [Scheffersomyces coipomensis]|uniref:thioredoxin-like protein n=1 Tax=Scheffersomyces coipomensis TaxID=1788519 RepID=UPI00315D7D13
MENMQIPVEVDPTEDTEWNDILRSHGIIPEKPPSPTAQLEEALEEAIKRQHDNRLEDKDLDELDELDDLEDEDFLNSYKQKRMAEMKSLNAQKQFGSVLPINKQEYETEITKASMDSYVLVHLTLSSNIQSRLLSSIFQTLAFKFSEIKFCEIPANRCIENYPEVNCPTLIIYYKTNVVKQYITLTELGGNATKIDDIERVLVQNGAVKNNDKRLIINNEDEYESELRKTRFVKKSLRGSNRLGDDDDEYDDDDDEFYD